MRFRVFLAFVVSIAFVSAFQAGDAFPGTEEGPRSFKADVAQVRELFEGRKFQERNVLLETYESSCEKDIRWEPAVRTAFKVFSFPRPSYGNLLDEWGKSAPRSWPPLLACAEYFQASGWKARGTAGPRTT